ncbi:ABC transporter permease [Arenimonas sp. GDDSR-1]|uniref:MlaE family ABC transporter permease n=1 Tax=Arenimonas sp. GDDSR-1 TaxID=2950125 RepID=UPI0026151FF1|nr:ABC transporter permease [Arenimonas sp. GDDSR-1]
MPMATWLDNTEPGLDPDPQQAGRLLASGDWTFRRAQRLLDLIAASGTGVMSVDASGISRLDATGSQLLLALLAQHGLTASAFHAKPEHETLINAVRSASAPLPKPPAAGALLYRIFESIGKWVDNAYRNILVFLAFLGRTLLSLIESLLNPRHWRVTSIVFHMQAVGLNAVPLVMLLSFMVGAVVAFLGATVLSEFGAQLWVVELVGVAFFREFGVLLTAILLAGRTASAFTAQIGSMKSGEELDAIRTMGLDPIELLVLPRLKALLLTLPLLTFLATMAGLLGGMAVCVWHLDISPEMFIGRLQNELSPRHFWVGMSKAPIFAMVIGLIGCLEGFKVENNAQSVGEHTTSSVVQSISLVILLDALAAMFFMELDL